MVLFYQFIHFCQEKFGKILGNIRILLYLCRRNISTARTGCASAIQASLIAFGLLCPCGQNLKQL